RFALFYPEQRLGGLVQDARDGEEINPATDVAGELAPDVADHIVKIGDEPLQIRIRRVHQLFVGPVGNVGMPNDSETVPQSALELSRAVVENNFKRKRDVVARARTEIFRENVARQNAVLEHFMLNSLCNRNVVFLNEDINVSLVQAAHGAVA